MKFRFDHEKNSKLIEERKIGFNDIIDAIQGNGLLLVEGHHNPEKYPNQKIFYVREKEEVYSVPFVIEEDGTIF